MTPDLNKEFVIYKMVCDRCGMEQICPSWESPPFPCQRCIAPMTTQVAKFESSALREWNNG